MCFSPQADLVGGTLITAIGIDAVRHVHSSHESRGRIALAALPLVFGAHQLDESLVWFSLQGHLPHVVGHVATWIYLLIAFVLLPVYVPVAVAALEPTARRRRRMAPFVAIGVVVASVLLETMIRRGFRVRLAAYHVAYGLRLSHAFFFIALYVVAVCGALLLSSYRHVVLFGLVNVVAIVVIARLTTDGFASVWCGWAALSSGAIAAHMRWAAPHRAAPYVLT